MEILPIRGTIPFPDHIRWAAFPEPDFGECLQCFDCLRVVPCREPYWIRASDGVRFRRWAISRLLCFVRSAKPFIRSRRFWRTRGPAPKRRALQVTRPRRSRGWRGGRTRRMNYWSVSSIRTVAIASRSPGSARSTTTRNVVVGSPLPPPATSRSARSSRPERISSSSTRRPSDGR